MNYSPAVQAAIARTIFHATGVRDTPPPYTDEQLDDATILNVKHARGDLSGIETVPNLRTLRMTGCDPVRFDALAGATRLRRLELSCCGPVELGAVSGLSALRWLRLEYCLVSDLRPLLDREPLERLVVTGCPLTEESYRDVVGELRDRGTNVIASEERDWRLTLRLHEAGLPYSYYRSPNGYHALCRPGLARTDRPEASHPKITPEELESLLDEDPGLVEPLFEQDDRMPTLGDVVPKGAAIMLPPEVTVWTEFAQIRKDLSLRRFRDSRWGTLHFNPESSVGGKQVVVRHFDGELPPETAVSYADIVRVLGNWLTVTPAVAELVEFLPTIADGVDFVAMPYRVLPESTASYELSDGPKPPPELARMRAAVREALVPFTDAPVDASLAEVITLTLLEPSAKTCFDPESRRFTVVDPQVSREAVVTWWETLHRDR